MAFFIGIGIGIGHGIVPAGEHGAAEGAAGEMGKHEEAERDCEAAGHSALDTGQFSFWSQFKVPFLSTLMAYWLDIDHLGCLNPHLLNNRAIFRFQVLKCGSQKLKN